jgi:NADH-quinone oxidoreductase subunit G
MVTSDTVTLTINGQALEAPKGTLLVEAAKLVGIDIPIFCYHPKLKPVGACRMCLVQIEKLPRLQTACTTPVAADMVVHTNTPEVVAAQNGVIELLLANHPLDCPICDKGGECPLQDNTFEYGLGVSRFTEDKRHKEKAYELGPQIVLDRERCIMCYRCVRFHQEIPGDEALAAVQRGVDSEIATLTGEPYDSIFAGNTIELCPVGALTSRQYRFRARPWDLVRTPSVCSGCAVGCNIEVHSRIETVLRLVGRENREVDDGWLCDKGRFGTVPVNPEGRLIRPMVRYEGELRPVSWDEALARTAELLRGTPESAHGSGTVDPATQPAAGSGTPEPAAYPMRGAIVASQALSNEAFFLLNELGLPASLWPASRASWPVQGQIQNLPRCKAIVLVGLDAWNDLPVLALWIRRAVQAGAKLVVIGEHNGLWRSTTHWLRNPASIQPFTEALNGSPKVEPDVLAAAAAVRGAQPAALLVHPSLEPLEALASALGANGDDGMVGAPLLGSNGRGAQDLAIRVAAGNAQQVLQSQALLAIGDEDWPVQGRLIVAASCLPTQHERCEVLLPLSHPYERQGSITNLEGRVQLQEGGASPPPQARSDWLMLAALSNLLGTSAPMTLPQLREAMLEQHANLATAFASEALIARV